MKIIISSLLLSLISATDRLRASHRFLKHVDPKTVKYKHDVVGLKYKTNAHQCDPKDTHDLHNQEISKSRGDEDIYLLDHWFNGICEGTYLEIGAGDGISRSNTYVFNKVFNWKGLLVEMASNDFKKLEQNRPNDVTVNAAVCSEEQVLHYSDRFGYFNAIWEFTESNFRDKFWGKNVAIDQLKEIRCTPVQKLLTEKVGNDSFFDFMSIDVEGAELSVVKSIDFTKVGFGVVYVETSRYNNETIDEIIQIMKDNGYVWHSTKDRETWFTNKDFNTIYKNFMPYRTQAELCEPQDISKLEASGVLKSQSDEDIYLLEHWFNGLCNGNYLEMGAVDGLMYSNSYVFNKVFNWRGVLIELSPDEFAKLEQNRPNEIARVNAAVCADEGVMHYNNGLGAVNGIWEFTTEEYRSKFWNNVTIDELQQIRCTTMRKILADNVGDNFFFDFYSLDVEGAELMVLNSIDFSKVGFGVLFLESLWNSKETNAEIIKLMRINGYDLHFSTGREMWFINKHFDTIYEHVLG